MVRNCWWWCLLGLVALVHPVVAADPPVFRAGAATTG